MIKRDVNQVIAIDPSINNIGLAGVSKDGTQYEVKTGEIKSSGDELEHKLADIVYKFAKYEDDFKKAEAIIVEIPNNWHRQNMLSIMKLCYSIGALVATALGSGGTSKKLELITVRDWKGNKSKIQTEYEVKQMLPQLKSKDLSDHVLDACALALHVIHQGQGLEELSGGKK